MIKMKRFGYIIGIILLFLAFNVDAQINTSGQKASQKVKKQTKSQLQAKKQANLQSSPGDIPVVKLNDSLQSNQGAISAEDLDKYRQSSLDIVSFLEGTLNFLGDPGSMIREKEVIVNDSYSKIFLSPKVQIEDDLDEKRNVPLYKDVQSYLKDVDFFFKNVTFKFRVDQVQYYVNGPNNLYFKITVTRQLNGRTIQGDTINSTKIRYIEVNLDSEQNLMKIASIYTTKINEEEEQQKWWNDLPVAWKLALGINVKINENVDLSQIMYFSDSVTFRKGDNIEHRAYDSITLRKESIFAAIHKVINIRDLDLSHFSTIDNLDPVTKLTDLHSLNIEGTHVGDLTPVRNLNYLETLNVSNCPIQSLTPLIFMRNIKDLDFSNTQVKDLSALANFNQLERLNLSGTQVDSISPIAGLSTLTDLRLNKTKVSDISPVHDLINLVTLQFSETNIKDISSISGLNKLIRLDFRNTNVLTLDSLKRLKSLQILFFDNTPISDLRPIESLPSLKRVYCDVSGVKKPEVARFGIKRPGVLVVFESEELQKWWMELTNEWKKVFMSIASISATPGKEDLHALIVKTKVDISNNQLILNIDPVEKFMNLQTLNLANTQIISIEPIKELIDLEDLNISGTRITNISALRNLKNLVTLDMDKLPVTDLESLQGLTNLKLLEMDGIQANKDAKENLRNKISDCLVVYQTDSLQNWWNRLSPDWKTIFGYPSSAPDRIQLHQIQNLKDLSFKDNVRITDLMPLKTLDRIQKLQFSGTLISDLKPLMTQKNLKVLKCPNNPIKEIDPLISIPDLQELDIEGTQVHTLGILVNLKGLLLLNVGGTQVKTIKYLKLLNSLQRLEIFNTKVGTLSSLETVKSLKLLKCYNTNLSKRDVARFKETHPDCEVIFY
jgi:Leucine-rich repeat (LRR) protein